MYTHVTQVAPLVMQYPPALGRLVKHIRIMLGAEHRAFLETVLHNH